MNVRQTGNPSTATANQLLLTVLPNGWLDDKLRLSVLVTPSLVDNQTLTEPFDNWPQTAANLGWTVTFADSNLAMLATVKQDSIQQDPYGLLSRPDESLWSEVFAGVTVKKRRGVDPLQKSWRVSHNISSLHVRHNVNRVAHTYHQMSAAANLPHMIEKFREAIQQTSAPAMFLHPEINSPGFANKMADQQTVLNAWDTSNWNLTSEQTNLLITRVKYAADKLKNYGGAPMSADTLCAMYVSCLESIQTVDKDPKVDLAIKAVKGWPQNLSLLSTDYQTIDLMQHYVELLLFHRRNTTDSSSNSQIPPPDFHQLLGLIHSYPAIMRCLGLVFDLVLLPPENIDMSKVAAIKISAGTKNGGTDLDLLDKPSVYTYCTVMPNTAFVAAPRKPDLIKNGLLNLKAVLSDNSGPRFTLVPENADGQSLKHTDMTNNAARAKEYTTSAPTAVISTSGTCTCDFLSATPAAVPNPTITPPAPLTVGLALFDRERLTDIEASAAQSTSAAPYKFYAEDLTLGYRVDILYKSRFYSLCKRNGSYGIFKPQSNTNVGVWTPKTRIEIDADEGFVSCGATQSSINTNIPPDADGNTDPTNTTTHLHQSVFTWTGWSLSIPAPDIPTMNDKPAEPSDYSSHHLAIRPMYSLPIGYKLPPLRFDQDYAVRCRVVDLAGNSLKPDFDPDNKLNSDVTLQPLTKFSRHEPYRAPHFLLREPIDYIKEPGTQLDRMVVRDGKGRPMRMLIAPRESLRLAELSGTLKSATLPDTAFPKQQLLADGAFPSVACAKQQGWVDGEISKSGDQDPIFISRRLFSPQVINPYLPDPRAKFVRVQMFDVKDDPSQAKLIGMPMWLSMNVDNTWPECTPIRVRVSTLESGETPVLSLMPKNEDDDDLDLDLGKSVNIEVKLPQASTVVLSFSTSPTDGTHRSLDAPIHLSHQVQAFKEKPYLFTDTLKVQHTALKAASSLKELGADLAHPKYSTSYSIEHLFNGSLPIISPPRTMTLVHAVKKPLLAPEFGVDDGQLKVERQAGKPEANVSGEITANWPSTSKLTCYATWTDCVDDVNYDRPREIHRHEVAFTANSQNFAKNDLNNPTRARQLPDKLQHHFADTRAHQVTYSLLATTNFREYYPLGGDEKDFQLEGKASFGICVQSSTPPNH